MADRSEPPIFIIEYSDYWRSLLIPITSETRAVEVDIYDEKQLTAH